MLIALLSAVERGPAESPTSSLVLGGQSVLAWQADLVVAMGCQRIICLCDHLGAQVLDVQKSAEARGVEFHAIKSPLQVPGLLKSGQELVMVRDSLLIEPSSTLPEFGTECFVATVDPSAVEACAEPDRFERIDRARRWAGLARIPASLGSKLEDFPPDIDTMSVLLRVALQAGVTPQEIDPDWLARDDWLLVSDTAELEARQKRLLERLDTPVTWFAPSLALADRIARRLVASGPQLVEQVVAIAGLVLLGMAVAAAWFEGMFAALVMLALGSAVLAVFRSADQLRRRLLGRDNGAWPGTAITLLEDGSAILVLAAAADGVVAAALPVFMIGLARIAAQKASRVWLRSIWSDRPTLLLILVVGALFGPLSWAMIALGLAAMVSCLLRDEPD